MADLFKRAKENYLAEEVTTTGGKKEEEEDEEEDESALLSLPRVSDQQDFHFCSLHQNASIQLNIVSREKEKDGTFTRS